MILKSLIAMTDNEHSRKVSEISGILATHSGCPPDVVSLIRQAALLHDAGKNGVDQNILNCPGKLTADEYEAVKAHTAFGARIIDDVVKLLATAQIIAKQHHERINASGYLGLPGDKIHPFAKIVAIADVCDALISKRPYKESWAIEDVARYFQENSGTLFDASLTLILLHHIDEIAGLYR